MDQTTQSTFFGLLDHFFDLLQSFVVLPHYVLDLLLFYFEFGVLYAVLLVKIGHFDCAVDHVSELVDQQKLKILRYQILYTGYDFIAEVESVFNFNAFKFFLHYILLISQVRWK